MERFAALPTSPSPALSRRGPSLSPLKGGEGLFSPTATDRRRTPIEQSDNTTTDFGSPDRRTWKWDRPYYRHLHEAGRAHPDHFGVESNET